MDGDYAAARDATSGELGRGLPSGSPDYLDGALANPALQTHHLLALLRNPAVTPALIQRIARSPIWMKQARLRAAMVLHPRTPRTLAMRLLGTLAWGDLLRAASTPRIASTVRSGAVAILTLRLPEMTLGEKMALARSAPAPLVPLLLRETHPRVARAVLENPRTRWADLHAAVERPDAPPAVLEAAAVAHRFQGRDDLRLAIAAHPRTPAATALRLVRRLDAGGLARLLERDGVPRLVHLAASRRLESGPAAAGRTET